MWTPRALVSAASGASPRMGEAGTPCARRDSVGVRVIRHVLRFASLDRSEVGRIQPRLRELDGALCAVYPIFSEPGVAEITGWPRGRRGCTVVYQPHGKPKYNMSR